MTVAGFALLAGGFATLIGFRSVLFGGRGWDDDPVTVLPETADPVRAEPTEVVLSWPPINDDGRAPSWSARNVNTGRAIFPGRPGDRPTVMENRGTLYVSRHAAEPPS
jgi:hypothetical protein